MGDKAIQHAYLKAIYRAALDGRAFEFTFSRRSIPDAVPLLPDPARRWAFVTAYNPMSQPLDKETNERRHGALLAMLASLGIESEPSEGREPDGSWREPGRILHGVSREQALALGRTFEQRAIVWCEHGKAGILDCRSEFWVVRRCYGVTRSSCTSGMFADPAGHPH